jgi:hypothetical protein
MQNQIPVTDSAVVVKPVQVKRVFNNEVFQLQLKAYNYQLRDTGSHKSDIDVLGFETPRTHTDSLFQQNFLLSINYKVLNKEFVKQIDSISETKQISNAVVIEKKIEGKEGTPRVIGDLGWLPFAFVVSILIFGWIKLLYQKYILQLVNSVIDYQVSLRIQRERNVLFSNVSFGLNWVYAINTGLFVFFALRYYNCQINFAPSFVVALVICLVIWALYYLKISTCKLLGNLFLVQEQFDDYIFNIGVFNRVMGLFLLPVIIFYPFTLEILKPFVLYSGLFIITAFLVLRIIRGFQILIRKEFTFFYLILYLCAVEILPVLVLVKILSTLI